MPFAETSAPQPILLNSFPEAPEDDAQVFFSQPVRGEWCVLSPEKDVVGAVFFETSQTFAQYVLYMVELLRQNHNLALQFGPLADALFSALNNTLVVDSQRMQILSRLQVRHGVYEELCMPIHRISTSKGQKQVLPKSSDRILIA